MPELGRKEGFDMPPTETLLTERELAARWRLAPETLANQRSQGKGVAYVRLGRTIRYRLVDVIAYEQTVVP